MVRTAGLIALLLLVPAASSAKDAAQCKAAIESYNSALSDISSSLRRYTNCVNDSQGKDDCSSEFRRLKSAQSDFETAVSEYEANCE